MERVALLIERELDVVELVLTDPMTLRRLKAQRIARAAMVATLELAAEDLRELPKDGPEQLPRQFTQNEAADWLQQRANDVKETGRG